MDCHCKIRNYIMSHFLKTIISSQQNCKCLRVLVGQSINLNSFNLSLVVYMLSVTRVVYRDQLLAESFDAV